MDLSEFVEMGAEMLFKNSALFLDRDGVINIDKRYVYLAADFVFINGIFDICRRAKSAGMKVVVVTNQAGIARGYYTEANFHELTDWMCGKFLEQGISVDKVYYCPYHPNYGLGEYKKDSFDRKPNPGMLFRARDELNICLEKSFLVGDSMTDIEAAQAGKLEKAVLFSKNGKFPKNSMIKPSFISSSLFEISQYLFN